MRLLKAWELYLHALHTYPMSTKYHSLRATTGMLIASLGDLISQRIIEAKEPPIDYKRNSVVGGYGFAETLIEGHFWLRLLERRFGSRMTFTVSLQKMLVDQLLFTPLEVSSFMVWTHVLEQQKTTTLMEKLGADLLPTLLGSYIFWCPISMVSFYLVPFHLRALYTCVLCVAWDTFMSFASHNKVRERLAIGRSD